MSTREPPAPPSAAQSLGGKQPRLKTIRDVRVFVAKVLRDVKAHGDPGDPDRARVLLYGAQVLARVIYDADIERRLRALERRQPAEADAVQ